MIGDAPFPECPNLSPDLIAYLEASFPAAIGTAIRDPSAYYAQCGEQRVVTHLADQLRRQREGAGG